MKFVAWDKCTFKEKLARWENAKRVLKNLPKHERTKHWNMSHWGIATDCGTVACAAGHCGLDPWFRKRGLILKPTAFAAILKKYFNNADLLPATVEEATTQRGGFINGQGGFENNVTVEEFFGCHGSNDIFNRGEERTVDVVIREIGEYINGMNRDYKEFQKNRADAIAEAKEVAADVIAEAKEEAADLLRTMLKSIEDNFKLDLEYL